MSYGRDYGGGGRRFGGPSRPAPVEVGKEYEVEVSEVASKVMALQGFRDLLYL
jgi:hypothetical protein